MAHEVVNTVQCRTHSPSTKTAPFPWHRCQTCDVLFCEECFTTSARHGYCPECAPTSYPPRDAYDRNRVPQTDTRDSADVQRKVIEVLLLVSVAPGRNRNFESIQTVDMLPLCS